MNDEYFNAGSDPDNSDIWQRFATRYQRSLGDYFSHLYNTIKFVDEHDFLQDFEEKKYYTDLLRAQMSSNELGLIFYNCLSDRGAKFKCLVERYSLFKDMDENVLLDETHKRLYDKGAFGTSDVR